MPTLEPNHRTMLWEDGIVANRNEASRFKG
mgnify:CR=1 FL=1